MAGTGECFAKQRTQLLTALGALAQLKAEATRGRQAIPIAVAVNDKTNDQASANPLRSTDSKEIAFTPFWVC